MQCRENAAIDACNDHHTGTLEVSCSAIAYFSSNIIANCFEHAPVSCDRNNNCTFHPWEHKASGQVFSNGRTWNVIIGLCGKNRIFPGLSDQS